MTAPIYYRFPAYGVHRIGLGRWSWEVTDGTGGRILLSGHALGRGAAEHAAAEAAGRCEEAIESRLGRVRDRLARDRIQVEVSIDDRGRVCVRSECACSDADHRRVMRAFLAVVGAVRWVRPVTEVQALAARATVSAAPASEAGVA